MTQETLSVHDDGMNGQARSNVEQERAFKRELTAERIYLFRPNNFACMVAIIEGHLLESELRGALNALIPRHPLLKVRISLTQDNHDAWFEPCPDKPFEINVLTAGKGVTWESQVEQHHQRFFDVFQGPLIKFTLLHGPGETTLVTCSHHSISDGMSIATLIKDILVHLAHPGTKIEKNPVPPKITREIIPGKVMPWNSRLLVSIVNRLWKRSKFMPTESLLEKIYKAYWSRHEGCSVFSWCLPRGDTARLVSNCRQEGVTVHTSLVTAFILAQLDVQGDRSGKTGNFHMPVDMRDKFKKPIGNTLGFYAASLIIDTKPLKLWKKFQQAIAGEPDEPSELEGLFWNVARNIHAMIKQRLKGNKLYRLFKLTMLDPTLLDATYPQALGLINEPLASKINARNGLKRGLMAGLAITNLGRLDMPTDYGHLRLKAIFGPSVNTEILEKIIGVCTLDGRMHFTMTHERSKIDEKVARAVAERAIEFLRMVA